MSATAVCEPGVGLQVELRSGRSVGRGNTPRWHINEIVKSTGTYIAAVVMSVLIVAWVLRLWHVDIEVPLSYSGDAVLFEALVKGAVENGWYLTNPRLGMPDGLEMHDFPMIDSLHFALMRIIAGIVGGPTAAFNLYFLLTFPLTALTALFALRRLGISRGVALIAGLLYAFLPYHFIRNMGHLFLTCYYLVPLLIAVVIKSYLLTGAPGSDANEESTVSGSNKKWRRLGAGLVCILVGAAGAYYAFFSCWLIGIAAGAAAVRSRQWTPIKRAAIHVSLICLTAILVVSPSLVYRFTHGSNRSAVNRAPYMAEYYGLKFCQLIFPLTNHRLSCLAHLKARYNRSIYPPVNEADSASLGAIAGLGFLALLGRCVLPASQRQSRLTWGLVYLNFSSFLLGTIGGLGYLICFVFPYIRCYNRISIFLGFFALTYVGIVLDQLGRRYAQTLRARWVFGAVLAGLLVVGVVDQTNKNFVPNYDNEQASYKQDAQFIDQIAAAVPAETMIYQLPYTTFVEHAGECYMFPYDSLHPYLHSASLRWSYGAMEGRPCSQWQHNVSRLAAPQMARALVRRGFGGIYIDRAGFLDHGRQLEQELTSALGHEPLVSANDRYSFFRLDENPLTAME
jgi:phosphoglycerol transferase